MTDENIEVDSYHVTEEMERFSEELTQWLRERELWLGLNENNSICLVQRVMKDAPDWAFTFYEVKTP